MPVIKTLIFTIVVPGTITVLIPYWLLTGGYDYGNWDYGPFRYIGILFIAAGAALYLWCAWDFAFVGRGTPAPFDPPKELVVRGPYKYVRNPMYVAVLTVLIGEAVLFQASVILRFALGMFILAYLLVRLYEEPALTRKFGNAYREYCEKVPQWVPRSTTSRGLDG